MFEFRQCQACSFRFPVEQGASEGAVCLRCGAPTEVTAEVKAGPEKVKRTLAPAGRRPQPAVFALLDNIRSVYNVGAAFRIADGAGLAHLYLAGITATPAQPKVAKTALGAERNVPWSYHPNALEIALKLKEKGYRLWALEEGETARSLFDGALDAAGSPILLIIGHERAGVDPAILAHCQAILSLPMAGRKRSLNAAVAFGIAAYTLRYGH